jgi:alkanesulfonate monooxygenase SsuD/methylene tetrahydromethanopterin reductase-like flavin-dependent oxidoreductase (luciferase family)
MPPKLGYLLPTREQIMEGRPEASTLLDLATRAEAEGFASVWVGDSILARPRHDPLTLLAGVAGRVPRVELGTAVLLPALRNPVLLAHQVATIDQISEGRLVLGVGFAADVPNIRAEFEACGVPFEKRIGRMMDGLRLCRALWSGQPVDWDSRWTVHRGVLAPTPYRPGGPPLWIGGNRATSLDRAGRFFDGWFPTAPPAAEFAQGLGQVREIARAAGREAEKVEGAIYVTVALDDDAAKADERLMSFLGRYYAPYAAKDIRTHQACYAGPGAGLAEWLDAYSKAGAGHFCVRFAGEHERHMAALAKVRIELGW